MRGALVISSLAFAAIALAQAPVISSGGIVNGASFERGQPITAGSLITIFGTGLASRVAQADSIPLATALGGVSVNFVTASGTFPGRMLYVQNDDPSKQQASQINLQVPWEV